MVELNINYLPITIRHHCWHPRNCQIIIHAKWRQVYYIGKKVFFLKWANSSTPTISLTGNKKNLREGDVKALVLLDDDAEGGGHKTHDRQCLTITK